jgi:hypothetical protein
MRLTRPLPPLRELCNTIADVSHSVDALCELLDKADTAHVSAHSVYQLLDPFRHQLSLASGEFDDLL